eukprot:3242511-Prymnesium_polylepis.1
MSRQERKARFESRLIWPTKPVHTASAISHGEHGRSRGWALQTVCLRVPRDLGHYLGRIKAEAERL